jgi:hypothetical protein
MEMI